MLQRITKLSPFESQLLTWIRTTGTYSEDGWASCTKTDRVLGLLKTLNIIPTVNKDKLFFTFVDYKSERFDLNDVDILSFVEEFFLIRNVYGISSRLVLHSHERLNFMFELDRHGYAFDGGSFTVKKIYKV